jgi:hypothetical protein
VVILVAWPEICINSDPRKKALPVLHIVVSVVIADGERMHPSQVVKDMFDSLPVYLQVAIAKVGQVVDGVQDVRPAGSGEI